MFKKILGLMLFITTGLNAGTYYKVVTSTIEGKATEYIVGDINLGTSMSTIKTTIQGGQGNNGYLGIGTANPVYKLDVYGFIRSTEGYIMPDGSNIGTTFLSINTSTSTLNNLIKQTTGQLETQDTLIGQTTGQLRNDLTDLKISTKAPDNLGNHIATQLLNMSGYGIANSSSIAFSDGTIMVSTSGFGGSDNLGNHIATQNLDMNNNNISNANIISPVGGTGIVIGAGSAVGGGASAIGEYSTASNSNTTAIGWYSTASGINAMSYGAGVTASADNSTIFGFGTYMGGGSWTQLENTNLNSLMFGITKNMLYVDANSVGIDNNITGTPGLNVSTINYVSQINFIDNTTQITASKYEDVSGTKLNYTEWISTQAVNIGTFSSVDIIPVGAIQLYNVTISNIDSGLNNDFKYNVWITSFTITNNSLADILNIYWRAIGNK
jgi:hypothetical protein